jgi:hypothetical protein
MRTLIIGTIVAVGIANVANSIDLDTMLHNNEVEWQMKKITTCFGSRTAF